MSSTKLKDATKRVISSMGLMGVIHWIRRWRRLEPYRGIDSITVTVEGIPIRFLTKDFASKEFFCARCHDGRLIEEHVSLALAKDVKSASVFFDIGAHLGWFTCLVGKLAPNCKVIAFEMNGASCRTLKKNIRANSLTKVDIVQAAVSSTHGKLTYLAKSRQADASILTQHTKCDRSKNQRVRQTTSVVLDELVENRAIYPDIVKIDTEGSEMWVLKGMEALVKRSRPILYLEVHPHHISNFGSTVEDVLEWLSRHDYQVFRFRDHRNADQNFELVPVHSATEITSNTMLRCQPRESQS